MKRKTSNVPTVVYKYALKAPTANAELVGELFCNARAHYNKLVTIENVRRRRYREARARLFPEYAGLEALYAKIAEAIEVERAAASAAKVAMRSRKVGAEVAAKIAGLKTEAREIRDKLRALRAEIVIHPDMVASEAMAREEAKRGVKALRKETYWGTYLLVETAVQQASSTSKHDVAYDDTPAHLLSSRLGVQFAGGLSVDELEADTRMQIVNPPTWRQTPSGKFRPRYQHNEDGTVKRCTLRFRVGSDASRKPVWAEFPFAYDRPLPPDSRIVWAYVTRRHCAERTPWQYHLCVVLETSQHERLSPTPSQVGESAVNFGWRSMPDGALRVATIVHDRGEIEHVELPARFASGIGKVRELQGLLDEKFEVIKRKLADFIASTLGLPELFVEDFEHVLLWKSQHKLCELARYWEDHRFEGDLEIYAEVSAWRERYLHLYDWMTYQRRSLLRFRDDLYGRAAKKLVEGAAKIVLDTFNLADVARKPRAEQRSEASSAARDNRVLAAPSDLRARILRAARKYHCEVVAADSKDATRRCNACGSREDVKKLEHGCKTCGAVWDQDVNNADNLLDKSASGEVVNLVTPAKMAENGEVRPSHGRSYSAARDELEKSLTTQ